MKNFWLSLRLFVGNHVVSHVPIHTVRLGYYRIVMRAKVGMGSAIHLGAHLDCLSGLIIGNNSVIGHNSRLDSRGGITIGNNVSISANVTVLTADHDLKSPTFQGRNKAVFIEDFVFIGTGAIVLPGVTLSRGSAVGAGSVVTKSVEAGVIVAGAPAKVIGKRGDTFAYNPSYRRPLF